MTTMRAEGPTTFELDDLASLPPMTKPEMMAAYDDVVTDHRLTHDAVQAHLDALSDHAQLFLGEYIVLAPGGDLVSAACTPTITVGTMARVGVR